MVIPSHGASGVSCCCTSSWGVLWCFCGACVQMFSAWSSSVTSNSVLLFLAQFMGAYFISVVLLIRMAMPEDYRWVWLGMRGACPHPAPLSLLVGAHLRMWGGRPLPPPLHPTPSMHAHFFVQPLLPHWPCVAQESNYRCHRHHRVQLLPSMVRLHLRGVGPSYHCCFLRPAEGEGLRAGPNRGQVQCGQVQLATGVGAWARVCLAGATLGIEIVNSLVFARQWHLLSRLCQSCRTPACGGPHSACPQVGGGNNTVPHPEGARLRLPRHPTSLDGPPAWQGMRPLATT